MPSYILLSVLFICTHGVCFFSLVRAIIVADTFTEETPSETVIIIILITTIITLMTIIILLIIKKRKKYY